MNKEEKLIILKEGNISTTLLKLGIPTMVGMIVSALYSVVDAYFVGGLGDSQMGAITVVFPMVQLVIGIGMMFGSGAGSYISRLLGKEEFEQADRTASTALFSAVGVGVVLVIISLGFLEGFLTMLGATDTMLPYAKEYAIIYIPGSLLSIFNVCMNNIVIAEGRARLNLIAMLLGCGLNVVFDPIFIYTLNLGVSGAAIATVTAQVVTMIMYLTYIAEKKSVLAISFFKVKLDSAIYKAVLGIGIPIFLFQLVSSASMALTSAAAKPYGDPTIAGMGAVVRIMTLGTYVIFGFMKGFQPFAGYNYGAKQYDRVKKATNTCLIWSTIFCLVTALIFFIFAQPIVSLFSKDGGGEMVLIGAEALRANAIVFPLFGIQMVYMSLFLSIGKAKEGGILSICRQGLFFIPLILILPHFLGISGIIWTQPLADVLTVALTILFAYREGKNIFSNKLSAANV